MLVKKMDHILSELCLKMHRRKKLEGDMLETPMNRCLSTFDITFLGVGHMIGAGIYVLAGTVATETAGPGVMFSFLIAGCASVLAALCYVELATRIPKAGSAYVYTYISLGEIWAFIIGWTLILEHMIGTASVARAWSGYVNSLADGAISNFTKNLMNGYKMKEPLGAVPDLLACGLCLVYAMLLVLRVKTSTMVNSVLTIINLAVMGLIIILGIYYADITNWEKRKGGFLPYGYGGIIRGAAICFYGYVGFDSIATAGEEARDPRRSIPLATLISMTIVILGYMLVSGLLTLVVPFWAIDQIAAFPEAFASKGIPWAKYVISVGALCGMTTTLFGSLYSLSRTMYSMANDGLLFGFLGRISERTQVPGCNLVISGILSALIALLFDLRHLVEFMSIGTLLAYTIVAMSVILLRYIPEQQTFDQVNVSTPSSLSSPPTEEADSISHGSIKSEVLCESERLKPRYAWMKRLDHYDTRHVITFCLVIYMTTCSFYSTFLVILLETPNSLTINDYIFAVCNLPLIIGSFFVIGVYRQNPPNGKFRVPFVPLIPALSILFNMGLIMHFSAMTWLRFTIWMMIGMMIYFLYGMRYSKETDLSKSYSINPKSYSTIPNLYSTTPMLRVGLQSDEVLITDDKAHVH